MTIVYRHKALFTTLSHIQRKRASKNDEYDTHLKYYTRVSNYKYPTTISANGASEA